MIDTNETGQKKLKELLALYERTEANFSEYEGAFLYALKDRVYGSFSDKQKSFVGVLYEEKILK
jgi:hypothetical protein